MTHCAPATVLNDVSPDGGGLQFEMAVDSRITAFLEGDREAGQLLLAELLPRLRNIIRALVGSDQDVEDITQQVMLEVIRGLPGYRGESTFLGWAGRIAVRVTLATAKKKRHIHRQETSLDDESTGGDVLPFRPAGSEGYLEKRAAVRLLDALPLEQRSAVVLHHVLGFTVGEIAASERTAVETVRSRLRLGMKRLRKADDFSSTSDAQTREFGARRP